MRNIHVRYDKKMERRQGSYGEAREGGRDWEVKKTERRRGSEIEEEIKRKKHRNRYRKR